jgi:predicted TIM-barrel fold metal-dependent hydrolase
MKKRTKKQQDEEAYQAALEGVRRLTEKQRARLIAELQDAPFRLDLADLKFDVDLSGMDLNLELPELDFKLPDLEELEVCPHCGKPKR